MGTEDFTNQHVRRIGSKYSLNETLQNGEYDCVFLVPQNGKRVCGIYPARPLQCCTWPFWNENLQSAASWEDVSNRVCPGINKGPRHDLVQIEHQRTRRADQI
jgi:Fe-S-cluster containining protein